MRACSVPPLADALLDRIGEVRRALAADIGIVLPGVRLRDDLTRDPRTYAIRVRDRLAGEGRLDLERLLAVADESILARLEVAVESEPVYGLPAGWIPIAQRDRATEAGALVFDPISVLGSHLAELARTNAADLLGRQEFQTLLEHLRASVPAVVKDVGGELLPLRSVHRAFGLLLREGAWPRDPVHVLETMLESGSRDPRELAESARRAIIPALLRRRGAGLLEPVMFSPELEHRLVAAWIEHEGDPIAARPRWRCASGWSDTPAGYRTIERPSYARALCGHFSPIFCCAPAYGLESTPTASCRASWKSIRRRSSMGTPLRYNAGSPGRSVGGTLPMRRTFSALVVALALSGCAALGSSLPYHASAEDAMGMTIEQYAVGRLPAAGQSKLHCAQHNHKAGSPHHRAPKGCRAR
ncbi:MAG TPA: FHIPEP family type III secretion protein [Candidatus Tumulicola sp.]